MRIAEEMDAVRGNELRWDAKGKADEIAHLQQENAFLQRHVGVLATAQRREASRWANAGNRKTSAPRRSLQQGFKPGRAHTDRV